MIAWLKNWEYGLVWIQRVSSRRNKKMKENSCWYDWASFSSSKICVTYDFISMIVMFLVHHLIKKKKKFGNFDKLKETWQLKKIKNKTLFTRRWPKLTRKIIMSLTEGERTVFAWCNQWTLTIRESACLGHFKWWRKITKIGNWKIIDKT